MHAQIIIALDTEAEVEKHFAKLHLVFGNAVKVTTPVKDDQPRPVTESKPAKAEKAVAPEPKKESPAAEESVEVAEKAEDNGALTYETVKEAVLLVGRTKGKAAARRALSAINATAVGPHIAEEDYSKLMAACNKELAALAA